MALTILNIISGGNETTAYGPPFIIENDSLCNSPLPFYRDDSVESLSSHTSSSSDEVRIGYFPENELNKRIFSGIDEETPNNYDVEGMPVKPKRKSLTQTIWVSVKNMMNCNSKDD